MRRILIVFISALLTISLYGCGGSGKTSNSNSTQMYNAVATDEEKGYGNYSLDGGITPNEFKDENKKLIVTGDLNLETTNFDNTVEKLNENIKSVNGYIQSSSISTRGDSRRWFNATIRVPADKYEEFLSKIKENDKTTYYSEHIDDITDNYTDLKARQDSLKAEEAKILEFYDKATTIEELMSIEQRLTEIRYEIDSIESSIKNYDLLTAYSTLNITIEETNVLTKADDDFFSKLGTSFINSFTNFINFVGSILIFIVSNLWIILLIVLIIYFVRKASKKRKAEKAAEKQLNK